MARRTKEDAEQTRQAILDSALALFYEKGFTRTTFDEIAKRIGLTKGAVYWHFRNKVDLLAELMRQKIYDKKYKHLQEETSIITIAQMREQFRNACLSIENDPEFCHFLKFVIFHMEWSDSIIKHILKQLSDIVEQPWVKLKERLTFLQKSGEIPLGVNVDETALLLSCLWRGAVDAYISKQYPMSLVNTFLQGFDSVINNILMESK